MELVEVDVAEAHEWAAHMRALRAEIGEAKADGRLSPDLGAPADMGAMLEKLLEQIDALPQPPASARLDLSELAHPQAWARYQQAVWLWAEQLRAEGVLCTTPTPPAERFELFVRSTLLDEDGPHRHEQPGRPQR